MHFHFEQNTNTKCDCNVHCMSWMGKVPDELPEVSHHFIMDDSVSLLK